ncbi:uncharacterized protein HMPREF1541_08788 [Cyphellophora europaea CBS 101466]|uniref:Apple domain-containing protein n=1 Tax=Cyphellophora europaea (strain CBS 101466) TaxID=1220924 RepID=W2RJJ1_CYPE1|nr:uncharacterized protein HMPREF1541_08788 [Cyphellophora europaea CBS 101466]ETN36510.1 hypothetical protein HMPREF1541_08788 [Cyphellophora europaea CBS 101466]
MAFAQDVWTDRGQNYACTNGSIQTDSNGYQYRIYCGYRHNGDNYDINKRPDYQPFHADTLDDCLNYCSRGGPLCRGVLYSEGLRTGYRNCYPKSVNGSDPFKLVPDPGTTTAIGILSVNSTCTSSSYTASGGGVFNTSCDTTGSGPDIKKVHSDNFEACIDECANYRPENGGNSCFGVLYEPSASGGFQNCYLKYDLQNRTSGNFNLAVLAEAGNGNGDDDSSSNAWIAGVVVGPVVAIAAAVGAFFWWRRRRAAKTQPSEDKTEGEPFRDLGTPHASSPYLDQVPPKYDASSQPPTTPSATSMPTPPAAAELGTGPRPTQELPAREQPRFEMQG